MAIHPDALDPEFLEQVRRLYLQSDEASKCFQIASQDLAEPDRRQYLDMALKQGGPDVRAALLGMIGETDEIFIADRARAAVLFLHGHGAAFWTATAEEAEQARTVILTHYGDIPMLQKTKADLAREAGLPTRDFVSVKSKRQAKPKPKPDAVQKAEKSAFDLLILVATEVKYLAHALDHGTSVQKLEAIERWFRIFGPRWPQDMIAEVNARLSPH